MNFAGIIAGPDLTEDRWIRSIDAHSALARPLTEKRINPFTRQLSDFPPHPAFALVLVDGKEVGSMRWSEDDTAGIVVLGEKDLVGPVAHDVALRLGATFEPSTDGEH